jgi:O-methyltransferase
VYQKIQDHTLVDLYRCYELWQLIEQCHKLPEGDYLEVGTWRGGTGALIACQAGDGIVHLCDTFTGVVKAGDRDPVYANGEHADTSEQMVRQLMASLGLENVQIHQGIFPEDTGASLENRRFRFCHIDVDVYQSAKDVYRWVWPRLVDGGLVCFDDYGFLGTGGVTDLVNEFRSEMNCMIVHNLNGHAVAVKI